MQTFPLKSLNLEEAKKKQFKLVDIITKYMTGSESLTLGDLGVTLGLNKPVRTKTAEDILAEFFSAEACMLLRGAGTNALRWGFMTALRPGNTLLVHDAPVYPTTETTIESMGLNVLRVDFNNYKETEKVIKSNSINMILIQHTRQKPEDSYNLEELIKTIKAADNSIPVIIDDNYAILKTEKNGIDSGADLSAFSMFKLLGPEGIGCLTGKKELIDKIRSKNYSGGGQVQGHEAMEVLRGLVYAPVALAIQAEENEKLVLELNNSDKYPYIKHAFLANAQSKVLLVEFNEDIAENLLIEAEKLGALPNPVGAESKYEIAPLFYRVSGTFLKSDPALIKRMIRINPNRAGSETIIRILENAYKKL
ncbi:aminotransferase class V-fold PLP-dependent enzyme [Sebaldella sp. S0638]|uniref:aminotransferase class V-fold PLP-dependent enzyme n=1 Tax=Sebaldella sp. S0638 TaxID=2957809 RepID=UPI0020A08012|nr:aminotransferase class V-fold PLP-dependent enzyme [Sebaldella sp. S0638]MCP1225726.1 aminotransferase class V-fold PLP-dependent enzyme [Sebaldella sp. S0638]